MYGECHVCERARWLHLACSVSQPQHAIWVILPARGASHIVMHVIDLTPFVYIYFAFTSLVIFVDFALCFVMGLNCIEI